MSDWESIRVPKTIHARVKKIAASRHSKMWRVVSDAIEGKAEIKFARVGDLEEELIGITDLITVLTTKSRKLGLRTYETGGIIHNMTIVLADDLEKFELAKGAEKIGGNK